MDGVQGECAGVNVPLILYSLEPILIRHGSYDVTCPYPRLNGTAVKHL